MLSHPQAVMTTGGTQGAGKKSYISKECVLCLSASEDQESLDLQLLQDNKFDLLKKAENVLNASNNYHPFQHL